MATVNVNADTLQIQLGGWETLWAFHGSFDLPLANIAHASTEPPPSFWESIRLMGTGAWPFRMAGTFLYHGDLVFFDFQNESSVLVIDLVEGASNYKHLFVHVDAPDTPALAAARINDARTKRAKRSGLWAAPRR